MKKFTLLFALVLGFGLTSLQAQSHCDKKAQAHCDKQGQAHCDKQASKSCQMKSDKAALNSETAEAAAKLASLDENIESKVCEMSGKVSYSRKSVGDDGEVKYQTVSYSASANEFVAVSKEGKKMSCGSGSGSAASANAGKASGKASGSSCCSKKAGKKSASMKQTQAVDKKASK
jgi:hypothetical protein